MFGKKLCVSVKSAERSQQVSLARLLPALCECGIGSSGHYIQLMLMDGLAATTLAARSSRKPMTHLVAACALVAGSKMHNVCKQEVNSCTWDGARKQEAPLSQQSHLARCRSPWQRRRHG